MHFFFCRLYFCWPTRNCFPFTNERKNSLSFFEHVAYHIFFPFFSSIFLYFSFFFMKFGNFSTFFSRFLVGRTLRVYVLWKKESKGVKLHLHFFFSLVFGREANPMRFLIRPIKFQPFFFFGNFWFFFQAPKFLGGDRIFKKNK